MTTSEETLALVGAGGHARELAEIARAQHEAGQGPRLLGFLDDEVARHGTTVNDWPVLGGLDWLRSNPQTSVVIAVGAPVTKRILAQRLDAMGAHYATLVHPDARLSAYLEFEPGVVVAAGCILTTQIHLGAHVHVNRMCTVGHDCTVGAYGHLAPGTILSGGVTVEEGCDLGTGVRVIPGCRVGAWSVIGAAACVIADVPRRVTAVGVPARVVRTHDETDDGP